MTRRAKRQGKPATAEGKAAMEFGRVGAKFDWTNEDWAFSHLPMVRLATVLLGKDRPELAECFRAAIGDGTVPEMLDNMIRVREHLKALARIIDAAVMRGFLVLEELGYGPDNPAPDWKGRPHSTVQ